MYDINDLFKKLNPEFNNELDLSTEGNFIYVKKEHIIKLLKTLKENYEYRMLADITSADYEDRFEVVYHVMTMNAGLIMLKVKLERDNAVIPSAVSVWKAADVMEREVYDLMGIVFEGHGNLKRVLCPQDFVGHPLRKDFQLNNVRRFGEKS